jgi:hypothetical protein
MGNPYRQNFNYRHVFAPYPSINGKRNYFAATSWIARTKATGYISSGRTKHWQHILRLAFEMVGFGLYSNLQRVTGRNSVLIRGCYVTLRLARHNCYDLLRYVTALRPDRYRVNRNERNETGAGKEI